MRRTLISLLLALLLWPLQSQTTIDTAVNFSAKDITGQTHVLYDILDAGKMVLIDFFSTSCGPCGTYAPHVEQSYQHFGQNNGNVHFLGISWGDSNQGVHVFDSTYGITYPSVSGTQGSGNQINIAYNILSYPTIILIMPDRSIREKHLWPPTTARIDSLLIANGGITTALASQGGDNLHIALWPNPARDATALSLKVSGPSSLEVQLTDLMGRTLRQKHHSLDAGDHRVEIPTDGVPSGLYLVHALINGKSRHSFRLVKE
ncbi:MAG TPA: redoxin domain-containing protein [Bacteroidales bacterium]|nr:redoxin domain-containing protein [Bacteroidales bacterium]